MPAYILDKNLLGGTEDPHHVSTTRFLVQNAMFVELFYTIENPILGYPQLGGDPFGLDSS
jgi:hypothetical protein